MASSGSKRELGLHQDKCLSQDAQVFACTDPFHLRRLSRARDVLGQAETVVTRLGSYTTETRKQRVNVGSDTAINRMKAPLPIPST